MNPSPTPTKAPIKKTKAPNTPKNYKHPNSVNLFKFTHMVLSRQKERRISHKDIGQILNFKPSDCSHWKKGVKNIKAVHDLNKIAESLGVDNSLIYDLAAGELSYEEAIFEWLETQNILELPEMLAEIPRQQLVSSHKKILDFVSQLHKKANFTTPPLFLPEIIRFFPFISIQPADTLYTLTRRDRVRARYRIRYKQGNLNPQTRLAIAKDLARVLLEYERSRYPELDEYSESTIGYELLLFTSELLCPKFLLNQELSNINPKLNLITEISKLFWVPKCLANYQLRGLLHEKFIFGKTFHASTTQQHNNISTTTS